MPHDPYKALYIHIPFCAHKCFYCDFYSHAAKQDSMQISDYVDRLLLEIRRKSKEGELANIETVYFGGGTPSHLGSKYLSSLLYMLSHSMRIEPDVEVTLEANPESVDAALVRDLFALGVNRMSIGVQSTDDEILKTIGRRHSACDALKAISLARTRFENVSADIICGIPGQSEKSLINSITDVVDAGATHVSIYPLTIEEHTVLSKMCMQGKFPVPDEDIEAHHMDVASNTLASFGFERYEVASYAKPGFECKHNLFYWSGVPYLGLGDSAVTMTQNETRRMRVQDGHVTDDLNKAQMTAEDLMLAMRKTCGVGENEIENAKAYIDGVSETFDELCELGLVEHVDERFKPTKLGWLCGNELYGKIFDLAP